MHVVANGRQTGCLRAFTPERLVFEKRALTSPLMVLMKLPEPAACSSPLPAQRVRSTAEGVVVPCKAAEANGEETKGEAAAAEIVAFCGRSLVFGGGGVEVSQAPLLGALLSSLPVPSITPASVLHALPAHSCCALFLYAVVLSGELLKGSSPIPASCLSLHSRLSSRWSLTCGTTQQAKAEVNREVVREGITAVEGCDLFCSPPGF